MWQYFHSLVTEVTHTIVSQDELIYITAKHSGQRYLVARGTLQELAIELCMHGNIYRAIYTA